MLAGSRIVRRCKPYFSLRYTALRNRHCELVLKNTPRLPLFYGKFEALHAFCTRIANECADKNAIFCRTTLDLSFEKPEIVSRKRIPVDQSLNAQDALCVLILPSRILRHFNKATVLQASGYDRHGICFVAMLISITDIQILISFQRIRFCKCYDVTSLNNGLAFF